MEIIYHNRNQAHRFSIEKVTSTIISEVSKLYKSQSYSVPCLRITPLSMFRNIFYVYRHRSSSGINHITGDIHYVILGLIGCKSIITIHDLVNLQKKQSRLSFIFRYFFWLYLPVKLSDKIICISEKTKNEVLSYIKTDKLHVIYNPIELEERDLSQKQFNVNYPRILQIGTKPNKNLPRIIESLKDMKCRLVIVGPLSDVHRSMLENNKIDFENKCNLSQEELTNEYYKADIVAFASTYEGFGMPIIEGQIAGCIVLTSNIAPMTEVGLDSVVYVNPLDVDSIRSGFISILHDEQLRSDMISKGFINKSRFKPSVIAKQYIYVYESVLN